ARRRRGLWLRRRKGEVCQGLRGGVDEGDESRPLRSRLISAGGSCRLRGEAAKGEARVASRLGTISAAVLATRDPHLDPPPFRGRKQCALPFRGKSSGRRRSREGSAQLLSTKGRLL